MHLFSGALPLICFVMTSDLAHPAQQLLHDLPDDGICANSPVVEMKVIGIGPNDKANPPIPLGRFYFYGASRETAEPFHADRNSFIGCIRDVRVAQHGNAGGKGGNTWSGGRDHLELIFETPNKLLRYLLRLPAHNGQWAYRSLLGGLLALDVSTTAVKLQAVAGREASFIQVFLDLEGLNQVRAQAIGPSTDDLQIAVDRLRRQLNLVPQFDSWPTAESQTPSQAITCEAS